MEDMNSPLLDGQPIKCAVTPTTTGTLAQTGQAQPSPSVKQSVGRSYGELAKTPTSPTVLRSDSMLGLQQAKGDVGSLVCDISFQMLRGCAQILEAALGPEGILF